MRTTCGPQLAKHGLLTCTDERALGVKIGVAWCLKAFLPFRSPTPHSTTPMCVFSAAGILAAGKTFKGAARNLKPKFR